MIRKGILLTITAAMLAMSPLCRAQTEEPTLDSLIEVMRADMQANRVTEITAIMNFNHKDAAAFWPIYGATNTSGHNSMIAERQSSSSMLKRIQHSTMPTRSPWRNKYLSTMHAWRN